MAKWSYGIDGDLEHPDWQHSIDGDYQPKKLRYSIDGDKILPKIDLDGLTPDQAIRILEKLK